MSDNLEKIEVGDTVNIFFTSGDPYFGAEILYTPCATGDSWRIRDRCGGIALVQMFERMILVSKKEES